MYDPIMLGSLTEIYTSTQLGNGNVPKLGDVVYRPDLKAKFIFLQNSGSSDITEKLACVALGTDKSGYKCALAAATDAVQGFAGVRVANATAMPQNYCGWFQCSGIATMVAGATGVTADTPVVTSADAAGKVEDSANSAAGAKAAFGEAVAAGSAGDVSIAINKNAWGV